MEPDDLHHMARMGLVAEAEDFFRETTHSRARKAANALDNKQRTPLHLACWASKVDMIRLLLDNRAECMTEAQDGFTPLHFCAQSGCAEGCQLLLEGGRGRVNAKLHKSKKTALHLAAAKGHANAALVLLQAGADSTLENSKGKTPLHVASTDAVKSVLMGGSSGALHVSADPPPPLPPPPVADNEEAAASSAGAGHEGIQAQVSVDADAEDTAAAAATKSQELRQEPAGGATVGMAAENRSGEEGGVMLAQNAARGGDMVDEGETVAAQEDTVVGVKGGRKRDSGDGAKSKGTEEGSGGGGGVGVGAARKCAGEEGRRTGTSLAERRRKKRKMREGVSGPGGAGGVSLSHLQGDGDEV